MLWNGWDPLWRLLLVAPLGYLGVILLLRAAGKRTLAKMNAFDFVVTIALGSTFATLLLNRQVALSEGLLAFGLLVALQAAVSWASVSWKPLRHYLTAEPQILVWRGEFLHQALHQERIREDEVLAALRQAGRSRLTDVAAVVLETDGSLSVVPAVAEMDGQALDDLFAKKDSGRGRVKR